MHNFIHIDAIPAKPAGLVNPAEIPLAEAVLQTSQYDLISQEKLPTLFRRLCTQYSPFTEEFWHILFNESDAPEPKECRVVPIYSTAERA